MYLISVGEPEPRQTTVDAQVLLYQDIDTRALGWRSGHFSPPEEHAAGTHRQLHYSAYNLRTWSWFSRGRFGTIEVRDV